ncbi:MAG: DNA methyltransferase [candidate division WOR-3 bacterium]|nr:DNA methyltransferase [candidate division WOR-3 bacterium]
MLKKKAEERTELRTGVIYCGDNLDVMERLPSESIDLIYIDPPFFSNRHYEVIWGNGAELRAFGDRWKGGINVYVEWMKERLIEMHRLLRPTGSIYVHLDWHAVHYIKCEMDDIFGMGNFLNEIIWCYSVGGKSKRRWARKHDTILFYAKSGKWFFDGKAVGVKRKTGRKSFGGIIGVDKQGRRYQDKLVKATGKYYRYYLDEPKIPEDWWTDINSIQSQSAERRGYPTQKPEALLERIIKSSSKKNDIVADFFMGGGTTLIVAERLGRRWIGCDVSPIACKDSRREIKKVVKEDRDIEIIGMPHGLDELKAMDPFEFQNHIIVDLLHGTCSRTKSADYGIDGHDFGHNPVQVKQSEHVGRPVVQKFESTVRREKRKKGIIVAFSFSKTAYEEAARIKLDEGIEIELRKVQELIADHYRRMGRQ